MTTASNPLFPDQSKPDDQNDQPAGYVLPAKAGRVEPVQRADNTGVNPAIKLIKEKLAHLYEEAEPDARREAREADAAPVRSPHQQFMHELSTSGKSLAEIQTAWHNYYTALPDDQKHQVWQEFYDANDSGNFYQPMPGAKPTHQGAAKGGKQPEKHPGNIVVAEHSTPLTNRQSRTAREIRTGVRHHVQRRAAKIGAAQKQNLHSLLFGLSTGAVVLLIFMFGFFNEVIIAPFIQPGRATAAPVILDNNSVAANGKQEVIIPKINVEIPAVYDLSSNAEWVIMSGLHRGIVHYPGTELPGQKGNVAMFGHSSSNILSTGKYKFAFVLLHKLQKDDTFYLTYNSKVYAYKVIYKKVVEPTEVSVLNDVAGETATATLITCDPPGTSLRRLVVVGRQISPNPETNVASKNNVVQTSANTPQLVGKEPSPWSKFWNWLF